MTRSKFIVILTSIFIFRIVLSFITWHGDLNNHVDWGIRYYEYGPSEFYAPESNVWNFTWPNQPPGTIYLFAGIRKLYELIFGLFWEINITIDIFPSTIITFFESNLYPALLKLPSILADFGIACLIYKFIILLKHSPKIASYAAILFLINPITWYNSSVWGQTDSIVNFLGLLSIYLLWKRKLIFSVVIMALCLYFKISLAIYLPIYVVVALKQRYAISKYLLSGIFSLVFIGIITIPFSASEPYSWLYEIYRVKVLSQQLHVITANAFNVWAFLTGIHERPNSGEVIGLTYKTLGNLLFFVSYIPIVYVLIKKFSLLNLIWTLTIVSFSSFMLLTNMHERYLYPFFPVFTIIAITNKKLMAIYLGISLIALLNLYNFWWYPNIEVVVQILSLGDRVFPRALGLVMFILYIYLYRFYFKSQNVRIFAKS